MKDKSIHVLFCTIKSQFITASVSSWSGLGHLLRVIPIALNVQCQIKSRNIPRILREWISLRESSFRGCDPSPTAPHVTSVQNRLNLFAGNTSHNTLSDDFTSQLHGFCQSWKLKQEYTLPSRESFMLGKEV